MPGEQVVVDGNVEAGDSEFFSLGALTVSSDHRLVAFAVDTEGDERFDLTIRDIATGEVLDTSITGIGYGVELSRDGQFVFYTRLDEAWRPHQLWRHRVGGDPARRRAGAPGGRRAVLDGRGRQPRRALADAGAGVEDDVRGARARRRRPLGAVARAGPAARGRRVRRRAGRRPLPHRAQHRHPRRRPGLGPVRRHEPRAVGAVAGLGRGRAVRRRRRVRRRHRAQPAHGWAHRTAGAAP